MASSDSHLSRADTGAVRLDIEELSFNTEGGGETEPLRTEDSGTNEKIDYVLVYERCPEEENKDEKSKKEAAKLVKMREKFERSLREEAGLILTYPEPEQMKRPLDIKREIRRQIDITRDLASGQQPHKQISKNPQITRHFVLIHAPWEVLAKRAEEMHIKAPFKENDIVIKSWLEKMLGDEKMESLRRRDPLAIHDRALKVKKDFFMANFRQDSLDKFVNHQSKENFFDNLDRAYIVQQLLFSARFGSTEDSTEDSTKDSTEDSTDSTDVGLKKMILDGAYVAGYPLHDGSDSGESPKNDRHRLKRDWARPGRMFKYQPYDAIKNYFGSEIAFYFAWVGFYTAWLVPLAIIGLIVFLYGIGSAGSHIPVKDVCDDKNMGKWYMCPLCDRKCSYWDLASTTCLYAYVTHFFDNDGTVYLAVIASIWGTLFLEFWKRRQGILAHELHVDSLEEEEEPLRPEFPANCLKRNELTGKMEPKIPKLKRYSQIGVVISIILFMIAMVIGAVVGVIIYRAAVFLSLSGHAESAIQTRARIITSATAASLNLVAINIMKYVYNKVAVLLTDWENPPTRSAYEYSFTWKMYLFQFVNTYASVFYIAFFKSGQMIGTPSKYERIADKFRLDGCSEQGCFLDLCVQLLVLMVGQQIIGIIMEIAIPYVMYRIKTRNRNKKIKKNLKHVEDYQSDFYLSSFEDHFMFWEYLQVVLQYGFATMFVAAFPLGPLFALLSSVIRIRADAFNFVSQFRRPDIIHAKDIGAWYRILKWLTKISILVNAFVLAFTSEFIPKLLYRLKFAPDHDSPGGGTLTGYINNSLSSIRTEDIFRKEPGTEPENPFHNLPYNVSVCRYRGYHEDVWPYNLSKQHWEVTAVRLAFVFVFQFTVYFIANSITRFVPDVPKSFALKTKWEKNLIKSVFEKKQQNKETQTYGTTTPTEKVFENKKEVATTGRSPRTATVSTEGDTKSPTNQPADIHLAKQNAPTVVTVAAEVVSDDIDEFENKKEVTTTDSTSRPARVISDGDTKPLPSQPADVQPASQHTSSVDTVAAEEPHDDSGSQSQVTP